MGRRLPLHEVITMSYKVLKTVDVPVASLEAMLSTLDDAISVCYEVDSTSEDSDRSYPFATGYSRSTMRSIREQLQSYMKNED